MFRSIISGAAALAVGLGAGWVFVAAVGFRIDPTATALPINIDKPPPSPQKRGHLVKMTVWMGGQPSDRRKGWIGVNMAPLELPLAQSVGLPNAEGVVILDTIEGGPASQVGLRFGDILLAVNAKAVANMNDVRQQLTALMPGSETVLEVWRVGSDTDNDAELLRMLLRQADGGDPNVMYSLGRLYAIGARGLPRNEVSAVEWYRKGTAAGGRNAKAALAFALLDGRGIPSDLSEGLRLLKEAAANDQPNAMNRLGHQLLEGRITEKDPSEAARLFTKAAEAGHVPSMVDLGKLYATGTGVSKDPASAAEWFGQAVRHNDGNGMVQLGWLYEHGVGVETDLVAAASLYRRASTLRNAGGMVSLALLYSQGRGVERNDSAAVSLYRDAVTLNHPMALNNLAWMLQQGRGVDRADPDQAADLMMKSLQRHNEFSRVRMTQFSSAWTKEFRRALQKRLTDTGYYNGPIDGEFDYLMVKAINAYFNTAR